MQAPLAPEVRRPVMHHRWLHATFLHWRYPAPEVQRLLPPSLEVETYDGSAWVGIVAFLMADVRAPGLPALPWLSRFPETNVRTYVRGPDGASGIWFFSLDAARLAVTLVARATYGLPYYWAGMSLRQRGALISYRSRRHGVRSNPAHSTIDVARRNPIEAVQQDELTVFLTARYRLYSVLAGRLIAADAQHPPWPLHEASVGRLDENLIAAAGFTTPLTDPLVHASPGVAVRVGGWHRL